MSHYGNPPQASVANSCWTSVGEAGTFKQVRKSWTRKANQLAMINTDVAISGMPSKSSRICPCGKQRNFCIPCGGRGVCPCGKVRRQCRDCNGQAFCPRQGCNKRKAHCLFHSGDHEPESMCGCGDKRKARCVQCGGSELCNCGRHRASCPEHGKQCECGRLAYTCQEHGTRFCPCGKRKDVCAEHGGSSLCPCGTLRTLCIEHGGGSLCPCGKRRDRCFECGGMGVCMHGKQKCKACDEAWAFTLKACEEAGTNPHTQGWKMFTQSAEQ
jgi:hypothetical protein